MAHDNLSNYVSNTYYTLLLCLNRFCVPCQNLFLPCFLRYIYIDFLKTYSIYHKSLTQLMSLCLTVHIVASNCKR